MPFSLSLRTIHRTGGILRSLAIYYGIPWRHGQLVRFYGQFLAPGDLGFDVGAHVGNRIRAWRALGARVVGVEPHPQLYALLQRFYGGRDGVTLLPQALGAQDGRAGLHISEKNPTVTTLSQTWIQAVQQVDSFADVEWERTVEVPVTTLDHLIAQYGLPAFCKIDVEGFELEVLQGLSTTVRAVSFEFIPATPYLAVACIDRLAQLGDYRFNWTLGEQHHWQSQTWLEAEAMQAVLAEMPAEGPSGDVYARLAI